MMKEKLFHTTFLTAICICCLVACTKPGDVTLPPYEPRLVLHGYTAVGENFQLALGKTMPQDVLAAPEDTYVNNGWVVLYENDVFVDSLKYDGVEERYVSLKIVAAAGRTYKVKAGAPGFPDIEAFTTAPLPVSLTSIARIKNTRRTAAGTLLDDVKVRFNDPPGPNFYLSAVYVVNGFDCVYTYDPAVERYAVNIVPFELGDCIDHDRILYTDRSFNATAKELTLSMHSSSLESYTEPATGKVYRPYFKKHNITEDHYRYIKTAINQDQIFEEGPMLTDPRTAKGNVKNGYGLFTVFAVTTDTIR